jgi:hypothetical protein
MSDRERQLAATDERAFAVVSCSVRAKLCDLAKAGNRAGSPERGQVSDAAKRWNSRLVRLTEQEELFVSQQARALAIVR